MRLKVLDKGNMPLLVESLMDNYQVIGPKAKGSAFAFESITDPADLRLDYDTTILPPKKVLQPVQERLSSFNMQADPQPTDIVEAEPTILFGVHTCDLQGIKLLDKVFSVDYPDTHYLTRREQTFIISLECLKPCDEYSFCKDMGTMTAKDGYDIHLTELESIYLVDVATEAGEKLLANFASVREATEEDKRELDEALKAKSSQFTSKLDFDVAILPAMLTEAFEHPIWDDMGERCMSCGSCTTVCPTCYCFNVFDEVDLLLTKGTRLRQWDSCQLDEFAEVAGGENFREKRASRQRHRLMRKGKYIYEKFDMLGCVGCGRCIRTCTAKISIVESFNAIYNEE